MPELRFCFASALTLVFFTLRYNRVFYNFLLRFVCPLYHHGAIFVLGCLQCGIDVGGRRCLAGFWALLLVLADF